MSSYYQNARELMVFYPFWCVLLALGFRQSIAFLAWLPAWISKRQSPHPAQLPEGAARVIAALALIATHFVLFYSPARDIFLARRDTGYMREYLAGHGVKRVLVMPIYADSPMAPLERNLKELTLREADTYDYLVVNRLYPQAHTADFMDKLRTVRPVVSFRNQISPPLFWYEFKLKKSFMDFDDELTHSRSLYRWKDVREYCRPFLKADG